MRVRSGAHAPIGASFDGDQVIRLRPELRPAVRGTFIANRTPGRMTIVATGRPGGNRIAQRMVHSEVIRSSRAALSLLRALSPRTSTSHRTCRRSGAVSCAAPSLHRPRGRATAMRSTWWVVPLAACLPRRVAEETSRTALTWRARN